MSPRKDSTDEIPRPLAEMASVGPGPVTTNRRRSPGDARIAVAPAVGTIYELPIRGLQIVPTGRIDFSPPPIAGPRDATEYKAIWAFLLLEALHKKLRGTSQPLLGAPAISRNSSHVARRPHPA